MLILLRRAEGADEEPLEMPLAVAAILLCLQRMAKIKPGVFSHTHQESKQAISKK